MKMSKLKLIAGYLMITIFGLILIFHILIITGNIPYTIVWGGRLQSKLDMYRFESVSILLNSIFLLVVLLKMEIIKLRIPLKTVKIMLWLMVVLFLLNTIGNLFSINFWERIIFTPLTLLLSVSAFVLVRKEK
jgi:hypothetical protein